ncbi:peroxidase 47 [Impatiens glandulifera]|uniref:peroxidase 47 n=1 Tax=Impatiens glandulifera TaxID=253017 RepID=UPI001FB14D24|nr:peroxidase 47 [Impatiens glandulifera]
MGIDRNSMRNVVIIVLVLMTIGTTNGLTMNYYMFSCPLLDMVVKNYVNSALNSDPTLAAALLRMHFHDCWIEGCDGSVLLDSTKDNTAEKDSPANLSLRGYELIDDIKEALEERCPGVVSCADIVAMAARDAVFFAGGPYFEIGKGRKDGRRSKIEDTINLPSPRFNSSDLIKQFGQRGFTVQDLVALSGGHTLGAARCVTFKDRIMNNADPTTIDADFSRNLVKTCRGGDNSRQTFDSTTNTFDNDYFVSLQRKMGLLTSDQTLFASPLTRPIVNDYAMNTAMFFLHFQQALIKMSLMESSDSNAPREVRQNCRKVN